MKNVDMCVIGSGSGGITAAVTAAGFGKKVLIVDKNLPGGECTWSGCVPSKALINKAKEAHVATKLVSGFVPDRKEAMEHVHQVRRNVYAHESPEALADMNIEFLQGTARFIDSKTIEVGDQQLSAKKFIIATGSSAFVPPVEGLDTVSYLTNEELFELQELPSSMIVLGGGPIGVELSQAMNRLGVTVHLVEKSDRIMPREEEDFTARLQGQLVSEGVHVHTGTTAVKVAPSDNGIALQCEDAQGSPVLLDAESILVAVGRRPNTEQLNLDAAGIAHTRRGITVNRRMQTNKRNIYAVGDVAGSWQFSHMANAQGIQAVQNAILPIQRKVSEDTPVWVTYTSPELARAGLSEKEARQRYGDKLRVYNFDFNDLDRTRTAGPSNEAMKLILDPRGKVLGASIFADRAGEMIGEIQVIRGLKANFGKLAGIIHPYPTYGEVFQKLGKKVLIDNLFNLPVVKLFRK